MSYNLDEIQKKRLAVKVSISICEKVLDNFCNTSFLDVNWNFYSLNFERHLAKAVKKTVLKSFLNCLL